MSVGVTLALALFAAVSSISIIISDSQLSDIFNTVSSFAISRSASVDKSSGKTFKITKGA